MKKTILDRLRQTSGYVSGQEICQSLGVSRTAVWKQVEQLRQEGYQIQSSPRRGYRLIQSPDRLTEAEVLPLLETRTLGRWLKHLDETGSTNADAKALARQGAPEGTLVVAEHQTQGRGRTSRRWYSAPGESVLFSLILRPPLAPSNAAAITQIAAAAVSLALDTLGLESQIKWPNDVLVRGKKICGILTEMTCELDRIDFIVLGLGLNANAASYPPEIAGLATSIRVELGQSCQRSLVLASVLNALEPLYQNYLQGGRRYLELCRSRSALLGRTVVYQTPQGPAEAQVLGLDDQGRLVVNRHGVQEALLSGEVHIGTQVLKD